MSENPVSNPNEELKDDHEEAAPAANAEDGLAVAGGASNVGGERAMGTVPPELESERVTAHETAGDSDDDTMTFKRTHVYAALIPLAFVVGLSVGFLFWGRGGDREAPARAAAAPAERAANSGGDSSAASGDQQSAAQPTGDEESVPRFDIPLDDDPSLGPEDAAITIVEFSDYECPYCRKFHQETFSRLLDTYPGQIRFVYRDFPLSTIHSNAIAAAEAANCAREQDVYWEYHDLLFSMEQGLGRQAYVDYADSLDLDLNQFEECLDSRRYQDEVEGDYNFAARLGIRSTPTFFINGLPVVGAQPFEIFQQIIDQELAGEIPG